MAKLENVQSTIKIKYQAQKKYSRTKNWIINSIYSKQIESSKKRWHILPTYTKKELSEWMYSQKNFNTLYNIWVDNNYFTNLKPSIDRLDDYKWYSFNNIQLTTWWENKNKSYKDRKEWRNNKRNTWVIQLTKAWIFIKKFHSAIEAYRQTWANCSHILDCAKNKKWFNTAWWFKWKLAL